MVRAGAGEGLTERLSEANIRYNTVLCDRTRTFVSIAAGCACGVLGFESWFGLVFYVLSSLLASACVIAHAGVGQTHKYFRSASDVVVSGLTGGAYIGSFVLFWTLVYDWVHIY